MLVYANSLRLTQEATLEQVFAPIARWLSKRERRTFSWEELTTDGSLKRSSSQIDVVTADGSDAVLVSLRYRHRDRDVRGRDWFVEVGTRGDRRGPREMSVVVKADEISARVEGSITTTRPTFLVELASSGVLAPETPGLDLLRLDEHAATLFDETVRSSTRSHALIIVSPAPTGEYVISPELIRLQVVGLADVVAIEKGANTYQIAEILGASIAAWRGAINIVLPPDRTGNVRTIKLLPDFLAEVLKSQNSIELEVLASLTHRTNTATSARHISPGLTRDARLRHEVKRKKLEAEESGDLREYAALLEVDNSNLLQQLAQANSELSDARYLLDQEQGRREDDTAQLQYQIEALKTQLEKAANGKPEASMTDPGIRNDLLDVIAGSASVEQCLSSAAVLFAERLIVLPSAFKSARESAAFRDTRRAFDLLKKLASYGDELQQGKSDAQARAILGNSYAARESETVESNKRAARLRTFDYNGVPVEMQKHVKIGVKDSPAETLRIHFEWDAGEGKIVLGHCGPHLPFR